MLTTDVRVTAEIKTPFSRQNVGAKLLIVGAGAGACHRLRAVQPETGRLLGIDPNLINLEVARNSALAPMEQIVCSVPESLLENYGPERNDAIQEVLPNCKAQFQTQVQDADAVAVIFRGTQRSGVVIADWIVTFSIEAGIPLLSIQIGSSNYEEPKESLRRIKDASVAFYEINEFMLNSKGCEISPDPAIDRMIADQLRMWAADDSNILCGTYSGWRG